MLDLLRVWTTIEEHLVVLIVVRNLVGIDRVVLKICEFQCYACLARKCLFKPLLGVWSKMGVLQLYHSKNAITWDWHPMNQTA